MRNESRSTRRKRTARRKAAAWGALFVIALSGAKLLTVVAAEPHKGVLPGTRATSEGTPCGGKPAPASIDPDDGPDRARLHPLPPDLPIQRHVVVGGGDAFSTDTETEADSLPVSEEPAAATGDEVLVYSNTLWNSAFAPGGGRQVGDDIAPVTHGACSLSRYEILVTGNADGRGTGPFSVDFALYEGCPVARGSIVPGTAGHFEAPNEGLHLITLTVPADADAPLPDPLWIGMTFSRSGAGWVGGAPALVGHSDHRLAYDLFGCSIVFGRFPSSPHSSFYARIWGRGECPASYLGYRAGALALGGLEPGAGTVIADDISVHGGACDMVAYQVGLAGAGTYTFDLRDPESGSSLPGTERTYESLGRFAQTASFEFDPPIPVPGHFWLTFQTDNDLGQAVLINQPPSLGASDLSYRVLGDTGWEEAAFPGGGAFRALEMSVRCAGSLPRGACCDMIFTDEAGEAQCHEVSEVNCPFPRWMEGAACDPDPFVPACGLSACCLADGRCEDRTANQCVAGAVSWHRGDFCDTVSDRCPDLCVFNEDPCSVPHSGVGCADPFCCAVVCYADPFCCQVSWDETCVASTADSCSGAPANDECFGEEPSHGARLVSVPSSTESDGVHATENPADPGFCCHLNGPGQQGLGTVWYKFVATETSADLSTCGSNAPAEDALMQVFRPLDPSTEERACNSLVTIGCSDDVELCADSDANAELCIRGLVPGETYYVMVAAKTDETRGKYRLDISAPCLPGPDPSPACPCGSIRWLDPPDGVVDARQPHPHDGASPRQGIDAMVAVAPHGADRHACWQLCETADTGAPNAIADIVDHGDGTMTLLLDRPITPGAVTTLTYTDDTGVATSGSFIAHPGNVNGDVRANAFDILAIIDSLNGAYALPWVHYSGDVDHSGLTASADILRVIDLLAGADAFNTWNDSAKPTHEGLCP